MKPEISKMHKVWDSVIIDKRNPAGTSKINFDEIISSIFANGPFYYYTIDFFDGMKISNLSPGFEEIHGAAPKSILTINDVLNLIHPDDMELVSKAEEKSLGFVYNRLGADKATSYKMSYNLRFKTADGSYKLFNHQGLILSLDENNNFIKSINIHTCIQHLTKQNNKKFSLIGLGGEPSYLNMDIFEDSGQTEKDDHTFSKREIEIIRLISEGITTKEIAEKLFISPVTVETHRKNLLKKSGCKNTVELIAKSISEGWI